MMMTMLPSILHRSLLFVFFLLIIITNQVLSLSKPVKKVAIIGSGIAGLATAHALASTVPDITVLESRSSLSKAGAGIQLNGGLAVLGKINPSLQQAVIEAGMPQVKVRSRCKAWNAPTIKQDEHAYDTLLELDLKDIILRNNVQSLLQSNNNNNLVLWISIMRSALQETLYRNLPPLVKVEFGKKLQTILDDDKNNSTCLLCQDGSTYGPFDLIIGCDGIKSVVKDYINIKNPNGAQQATGLYTGLRIRYAVQDAVESTTEQTATLTQYFGDAAYCLDGIYGAGPQRTAKCAFIIFLDPDYFGPFRRRNDVIRSSVAENADWTQDNRETTAIARETMLRQIRDAGIPDADLGPTIAQADRFFELGVYAHNPFSAWSKHAANQGSYVVLCGDAAHALPPFLGQGANQAIQDAYSLAKRIEAYNTQVNEGEDVELGSFLKEYERVRWWPNFQIFWKSSFLGYLETGGFDGAYAKFRDVFFKTMGVVGVAERVLLDAAIPKV